MKLTGNKKWIAVGGLLAIVVVAVVVAVVLIGSGKDVSIDDVTGNKYKIENGVVVYDGEGDKSAEVVQYEEPKKDELIARIHVKNYGEITVRFFSEQAPLAVENFVTHVKEGYYDGLTFHRIINDFMIQGGDPTGTGGGGESIWKDDSGEYAPFEDEFSKYLMPIRGALCMANSGSDTNGSQFFIVQTDAYRISDVMSLRNSGVDKELVDYYKENGGAGWLYGAHTVFGQVIEGYDVLDEIADKTGTGSGVPAEEVIIEKIELDRY